MLFLRGFLTHTLVSLEYTLWYYCVQYCEWLFTRRRVNITPGVWSLLPNYISISEGSPAVLVIILQEIVYNISPKNVLYFTI